MVNTAALGQHLLTLILNFYPGIATSNILGSKQMVTDSN